MIRLDFEPIPDTRFMVAMQPVVPGMRMLRSTFSPGFTLRDDDLIKDGDDSIGIVISRSNRIDVFKSRDFQLGHGDAAMLRVSEPGRLGSVENFQYVALMVPAIELKHRAVESESERFLSRKSEGLQLLRTYISALEKQKGETVVSPFILLRTGPDNFRIGKNYFFGASFFMSASAFAAAFFAALSFLA